MDHPDEPQERVVPAARFLTPRRQPPVYSPITAGALWNALARLSGGGDAAIRTVTTQLSAEYLADAAVLFGSGTQALQVAFEVAARSVGDSLVALPAFACFDVASAAVGAGSRIALYDIDPVTLGPDLDSLRRVLERGARVVVIAPLYGVPVDWGALEQLCAGFGAIAVEDAAQGHGGGWRGRPLGSLGSISVLSFGRGKGWTGGAGGALLLRGPHAGDALAAMPRAPVAGASGLRLFAQLAAQWLLGRPGLFALPSAIPWLRLGETIYRDPVGPRPMSALACASLLALRGAADREASVRRATGAALAAALESRTDIAVTSPPGASPGFLRFPVRLPRGLTGFARSGRAAQLGLAPSYPAPLAALPPVRARLDGASSGWPGAEALSRILFTVPTHSFVTPAERAELIQLLQTYRG